jgi:hypothetical protein
LYDKKDCKFSAHTKSVQKNPAIFQHTIPSTKKSHTTPKKKQEKWKIQDEKRREKRDEGGKKIHKISNKKKNFLFVLVYSDVGWGWIFVSI